ncbi:MAG: ABC-type transport auxiliary lipoprotein family protein [Desulfatibacillaceae bacterium]|nr:ABC-type transport auxiliary lipoprotein family protein [Desulfatibacillaceae bacterium]
MVYSCLQKGFGKARFWLALLLLLVMAAVIAGCSLGARTPRPDTSYYTLEYEPGVFEGRDAIPVVLRLAGFTSSPEISTTRIVYKDAPFAAKEYYYHRWRAKPNELVGYFLARDMDASGLFDAALYGDAYAAPTHALEGRVDAFYESSISDPWQAVLKVSVVLTVEKEPDPSKQVVFQRTYAQTQVAESKSPKGVAGAMSRAMSTVSTKIIEDVYEALK